MKRIITLAIVGIFFAGCADDFRSYEFTGGLLLSEDFDFYELKADFFPTEDDCDLLVISQRDDKGEIIASSGCIVRVNKKEKRLEIAHKEIMSPEVNLVLNNGDKFHDTFDFILGYGDSFRLESYPDKKRGYSASFKKGTKSPLDLYKKK